MTRRSVSYVLSALTLLLAGAAWAHEGHEAVEAQLSRIPLGLEGVREMISIHPLFVHFPIALLTVSGVFYLLGAVLNKEGLLEAGRWTLYAGTVSAAAAIGTGLKAAGTVPHDEETHQIMLLHQNLAYIILFLGIGLCAWTLAAKAAIPRKGRTVFLIISLILIAVMAQQADLGGRMVFLKGAGVGKKSMLQEAGHAHSHGSHEHP
jgi:uncharacterized membrane protein